MVWIGNHRCEHRISTSLEITTIRRRIFLIINRSSTQQLRHKSLEPVNIDEYNATSISNSVDQGAIGFGVIAATSVIGLALKNSERNNRN